MLQCWTTRSITTRWKNDRTTDLAADLLRFIAARDLPPRCELSDLAAQRG